VQQKIGNAIGCFLTKTWTFARSLLKWKLLLMPSKDKKRFVGGAWIFMMRKKYFLARSINMRILGTVPHKNGLKVAARKTRACVKPFANTYTLAASFY
jgi:hypothetical protein